MQARMILLVVALAVVVSVGWAPAAEPAKRPGISGDWVGTWGSYSPPKDGEPQPAGKYTKEQLRLDCKVVERDGKWQATFEGECGRPYKYTIQMDGRQADNAVLFKGTVDLGEKDGGVYDWIGRAAEEEFVGFYTSKKYTGHFRLARPKESQPDNKTIEKKEGKEEPFQGPTGSFGDLIATLKTTPGCRGYETAKTASGKQVCFAWFEDKKATVKFVSSDEYRQFTRVNFPDVMKADREPLRDLPEDSGPIMVIAAIKFSDEPTSPEKRLSLSQFSIEHYKPLKRGGSVGGGFAPASVSFPAGRKPTLPAPNNSQPTPEPRPGAAVEQDPKRVFDEVFDDLMAALKKSPGCLGSETFVTPSGKQAACAWFEDKKAAATWFSNDEHLRFIKANFPGAIRHVPLRDVADDCGPILTISSIIFNKKPEPKEKRLPLSHIGIELYQPLCREQYVGSAFSPESVPFPLPKKAGKEPAAPAPGKSQPPLPVGRPDDKSIDPDAKPTKPGGKRDNPAGPVVPQQGSLKPGDAAPDFTLTLLDDKEGRTVTLSKLQGQKPVVLSFGSFT